MATLPGNCSTSSRPCNKLTNGAGEQIHCWGIVRKGSQMWWKYVSQYLLNAHPKIPINSIVSLPSYKLRLKVLAIITILAPISHKIGDTRVYTPFQMVGCVCVCAWNAKSLIEFRTVNQTKAIVWLRIIRWHGWLGCDEVMGSGVQLTTTTRNATQFTIYVQAAAAAAAATSAPAAGFVSHSMWIVNVMPGAMVYKRQTKQPS